MNLTNNQEEFTKKDVLNSVYKTNSTIDKKTKESFFTSYVNKKGWDITNLTNEQINEIKSNPGYNGIILS